MSGDYEGLGVINRPCSPEALRSAMIGDSVRLADTRRRARRHVRVYYDKAGRPFVRDRLYGRRYIVSIRFLTIDGVPLECGSAVLESVE